MRGIHKFALFASAAVFPTAQLHAVEINFTGSMSGISTNVSAPSCAPQLFLSTLTGTGTSSLGNFTYTHHVCLSGPGPLNGVDFLLDFGGGDTLQGNMVGVAVASGVPLLTNVTLNYSILAGTGQYLGATGAFRGLGTVDQRNSPPTLVSFNFAPVPEPATWMVMLLGFGAIGLRLRRQRRTRLAAGATLSRV